MSRQAGIGAEEKRMSARLHSVEVSGNCYKVRLLCALLGVQVEIVPLDFVGGAHKKSPFIDLNPFGQLPVFEDGDIVLRDSQAILVYIGRKWGGEEWLPTGAASLASVAQWLMVAENEVARGLADARLHDKFGRDIDIAAARDKSRSLLAIMDAHLRRNEWLALGRPTIADIACMPYIALGHEGGVTLESYPAVEAWIDRIKKLPGFIGMPGILDK
jgi:glutathione S-transferase